MSYVPPPSPVDLQTQVLSNQELNEQIQLLHKKRDAVMLGTAALVIILGLFVCLFGTAVLSLIGPAWLLGPLAFIGCASLIVLIGVVLSESGKQYDTQLQQLYTLQQRRRQEEELRQRQILEAEATRYKREALMAQAREAAQVAGLPCRRDLPIIGPPKFVHSVYRVLGELKDKVPHRYQEVLRYLPKAEYAPGHPFAGRSDGLFTLDGSGNIPHGDGWYTRNSYEDFRHTFLHEVGHCIGRAKDYDPYHSEEEADEYRRKVLRELGVE